eukprot:scaffold22418_cov45-Phaeocystis_antarctica.AAC.1
MAAATTPWSACRTTARFTWLGLGLGLGLGLEARVRVRVRSRVRVRIRFRFGFGVGVRARVSLDRDAHLAHDALEVGGRHQRGRARAIVVVAVQGKARARESTLADLPGVCSSVVLLVCGSSRLWHTSPPRRASA